jgi:hypothetical protein
VAGNECPRCGLLNPATAERCDCGFQFNPQQPTGRDNFSQGSRAKDPFPARVVVVDVEMRFWSMVAFMVKWAIASIPALVILILLGALAAAVFPLLLTLLTPHVG